MGSGMSMKSLTTILELYGCCPDRFIAVPHAHPDSNVIPAHRQLVDHHENKVCIYVRASAQDMRGVN